MVGDPPGAGLCGEGESGVNEANDLYLAFCEARRVAVKAWRDYLATKPLEHIATDELMSTQAAFRGVHDVMTGRNIIDVAGDDL